MNDLPLTTSDVQLIDCLPEFLEVRCPEPLSENIRTVLKTMEFECGPNEPALEGVSSLPTLVRFVVSETMTHRERIREKVREAIRQSLDQSNQPFAEQLDEDGDEVEILFALLNTQIGTQGSH